MQCCGSPSPLRRGPITAGSARIPSEASVVCECCPATTIGTFLGGPVWMVAAEEEGGRGTGVRGTEIGREKVQNQAGGKEEASEGRR